MLKKEAEQRQAVEMLCTDMLVPREHLLRKIDAAVNFARIYELVEDLYCEDNGRPSCDPVVLFKLVMIQHLFGIRSLRQTMRDAEVNVAYRWFLGYTMSQQLPHFATISYAFRHRFTAEVIEGVFRWILEEVARTGYLSPEVVFVDGTHIKANANLKKQVKKAVPVAAKRYQEQLDEEIEADRAAHGWGIALAMLLHQNGHEVTSWTYLQEECDLLHRERCNEKLLPGVVIPEGIEITTDMSGAAKADLVVLAVPSFAVASTAERLAKVIRCRRIRLSSTSARVWIPSTATAGSPRPSRTR